MSLVLTITESVLTSIYYGLYLCLILVVMMAPIVPYCKRIKKKLNSKSARRFFKQHDYLMFCRRKIISILLTGEKYGPIMCEDLLYGWKNKPYVISNPYALHSQTTHHQHMNDDNRDYCKICYTDELYALPTIKLESCKHTFHLQCIETILKMRWNGAKISFQFRGCPLCKIPMKHPKLDDLNKDLDILYGKLGQKLLKRLKYEKLDQDAQIINENGRYYQNEIGFAMNKFAYYLCFKCDNPYYVGLKQCLAAGDNPDDYMNAEYFICLSCRDNDNIGSHAENCPIHGKEYIEYKCKFCCSISTFSCGSTHFCEMCHKRPSQRWQSERDGTIIKTCPILPNKENNYDLQEIEIDECPLGIKHPQHGIEYCLGCGLCNAEKK